MIKKISEEIYSREQVKMSRLEQKKKILASDHGSLRFQALLNTPWNTFVQAFHQNS